MRCLNRCQWPFPRLLPADLQPVEPTPSPPSPFCTRRVLLFYDTKAFTTCCGKIFTTNGKHPLEKLAYRQIGALISAALRKHGVQVVEYTLEEDLWKRKELPVYDLCIILTHDWPTVHEDTAWASEWLEVLLSQPSVPSHEQVLWLFEKTNYVSDILACEELDEKIHEETDLKQDDEKCQPVPSGPIMLPTRVVQYEQDLDAVAKWLHETVTLFTEEDISHKKTLLGNFPKPWAKKTSTRKFVTKENFSAGKEGVSFPTFTSETKARQKLGEIFKNTGAALPRFSFLSCIKKVDAEEVEGYQFIGERFKGKTCKSIVVQHYEPRFAKEAEKRLYFCLGQFLYGVGNVGWIDVNGWPTKLPLQSTVQERRQCQRLMTLLPRLTQYACVRLDFGPDALLSEIEILPDFFGGPAGDLRGEEWEAMRHQIANAYIQQALKALGSSCGIGPSPILSEGPLS